MRRKLCPIVYEQRNREGWARTVRPRGEFEVPGPENADSDIWPRENATGEQTLKEERRQDLETGK